MLAVDELELDAVSRGPAAPGQGDGGAWWPLGRRDARRRSSHFERHTVRWVGGRVIQRARVGYDRSTDLPECPRPRGCGQDWKRLPGHRVERIPEVQQAAYRDSARHVKDIELAGVRAADVDHELCGGWAPFLALVRPPVGVVAGDRERSDV